MKTRTYALIMTLILILHYLVPYYVTRGSVDGIYWTLEALSALLLTFYYIGRGDTEWRRS